ncbi:hypothetical protein [Benzoatithermus flavus]|uniref:Uncharacterized protein n=1 Tax=Benzoatithermus flavus TaxID=3108223 RepID=A0ABU8XNP0_9PROT
MANATLPPMMASPPMLETDPHVRWLREIEDLEAAAAALPDSVEPGSAVEALYVRAQTIEDDLLATPARTVEGALAQLERLAAVLPDGGDMSPTRAAGLRNALVTLRALARTV